MPVCNNLIASINVNWRKNESMSFKIRNEVRMSTTSLIRYSSQSLT